MTKRIIALLLALILTVGLLPTVALAAEGNPTTDGGSTTMTDTKTSGVDSEGNTDNPVHIVKSVTTDANGNGTLKLEAYVTDPMTIKTSDVPLDIVLVLDQSGSMGFCINCEEQTGEYKGEEWKNKSENCPPTKTYEFVGKAQSLTSGEYYAYKEQKPKKVTYCDGNHFVGTHQAGWYWANKDHYNWNRLGDNADLYKQVTKTSKHVHRLDTLKTVLTSFTNSVKTRAADANVAHRIAMVGFASSGYNNTEILTGVELSNGNKNNNNDYYYFPTYAKINGVQKASATTTDYKNALVDVSQTTGQSSVTAAIGALTAQGGTQTDDGLEMAAKIFENNPLAGNDAGRKRIVILFTDGDSDDEKAAKEQASALKNTYNATVYTVGLFAGADQTKTNGNNGFLQNVSSNNGKAPREGEKSYYLAANDAISLQKVFEQITEEVNKLMLNVGTETILSDTLSTYFDFDIPEGGSLTTEVKFQTVPVINKNDDGTFTWDEDHPTTITYPTLEKTGAKSFTVKNFDYGSNANKITRKYNPNNEIIGYTGNKLVIEIPIKADTNCTSWDATKNFYPTNSSTNGAKLEYKDEKNNPRSTGVDSPEAPVARYSVTYDYGTGSEQPTGVSMSKDTRAYIDGQTIDVKPTLTAPDGYTFDGWYTDAACTPASKVDAANPPAIDKANRTLYGKFTKSVFTVDFSEYVKKHLELTGVETLPGAEAFTVTGKEYKLVNGSKEYTGKNFAGATNAILNTASGDVAFTGAGMSLSLSAGEHTFEVKETVPTDDKKTPGMTYSTTEYTLKISIGSDGNVTVVEPGTKVITITNTYAPEAATLDLTGKFKKVLTSNTFALPTGANSFKLTIKNGTTEVAKGTAAVALGTTPDATGKFTGEANFTFTSGSLTFTSAGTYNYKVTETDSGIAGMKYASEADLTIVVENDPVTGKLKVASAMIDGVNIAAATGTNTVTINNTFTAAELPLDPTQDPSGTFTRVPIAKEMTGEATKEDLTFTAEIYNDANVKVTQGTAKVEKATTAANFSGFGALTFNTTGDHTFTIKEAAITPAIPGMTYDVGFANGHTMIVNVDENTTTNELYVKSVTIDGKTVYTHGETEATPTWLTITNNYIEPKKTFDLNNTIFKTFTPVAGGLPIPTGEGISYTFTARMTELTKEGFAVGDTGRNYTLEATLTGEVIEANKVPFTVEGASEVSFAPGTYYFLVQEDSTAAVTGTVNGTIHNDSQAYLLILTVKEDLTFETDVKTAVVVTSLEEPTPGLGTITFNNTYEEKEPGTYTIDFSDLIVKCLTKEGSKAFTGAEFTASVTGWKYMEKEAKPWAMLANATSFAFTDLPSRTLTATFPADAVFNSDNDAYRPFTGDTLTVEEGDYLFLIEENNGGQSNITYDEAKYWLAVRVRFENDEPIVAVYRRTYTAGDSYNTVFENETKWSDPIPANITPVTFYNTIDTGKDDYYPIIIPTIINKDTGMLNKTDHFAYVIGYPDGTVHPNGQITRAEVATIFFRLLRDEVRDGAFTTSNTYSDVAYGKWYNNPISTMSALGIITGYPDGTFKPNKPITRAEFAAIAARFDETQSGKSATFSDVIGHWAAKEIGIAYYNDWIKGYPDGTFKPDQNITRAEAMTLINRVLERKPESPADLLTNMNKWTDNMDTSKWYYLDVQEATNSHGYTRKTFNYELWRQMLNDPDWSRYER